MQLFMQLFRISEVDAVFTMRTHDPRPVPSDPDPQQELPSRQDDERPPVRPEPTDDKPRDNKK